MTVKEQLDKVQGLVADNDYHNAATQLEHIYRKLKNPPPRLYILLARAYKGMSREEQRITLLKEGVSKWPDNFSCLVHLAVAYNDAGKPEQTRTLLKNVRAKKLPPLGLRALSKALLSLDQVEESVDTLLSADTPLPPNLTYIAATAACRFIFQGGPGKVTDIIWALRDKVLEKEKFSDFFCKKVLQYVVQHREYFHNVEALWPLKLLFHHPEIFNLSSKQKLKCAQIFFVCRDYKSVKALIQNSKFSNQEENQQRKWLLALVGTKTSDFTTDVDGMVPDEILEEGSLLHFKYGKEKCLIWFSGIQLINTAYIFTSFVPLLKVRKISLLIVQDNKSLMSLAGFGAFPDRESSIQGLGNILATLGYTHYATSSNSGSGLSALIYGCRLNVEGIYGINALTELPEDKPGVNQQALHHRNTIFKHVSMPPLNSHEYIRSAPKTKIFLNYAKYSDFDRENAEHVSDLPNVTLWPEDYSKHSLLLWLNEENTLTGNVGRFFDILGW